MNKEQWDERYRGGDLPWDSPTPSEHLAWAVEAFGIAPGKAVDIACGRGVNTIWLAQHGFEAVGVDISSLAVEQARARAAAAGVNCTFAAVDFLREQAPGGPFAFAFDRGGFHSVSAGQDRATFARAVAALLDGGGLWLSIMGSTDAPARETGPPQVSAGEIAAAVEGHFEILRLEADYFHNDGRKTRPAWRCVMRKRPPGEHVAGGGH